MLGTFVDPEIDDHERLTFLTTLVEKVNKPSSQDAYVYALVAGSDVKLRLSDYDGAHKDLDKAESILDTFDSVETEVHATFYRINASYYQVWHPLLPNSRRSINHIRLNLTSPPTIKMPCYTSPA